jgi:DNA repair exonuclease SbcCD nuclease subunit
MGKVLITADIHFGIPKRLNDILWALKTMREFVSINQIDAVVILGDLFHDRVNLNIEVLTAVYNFFEETRALGQEWLCFPGNHDMFLRNEWSVNSLRSLSKVLTIIEDIKLIKLVDTRFWILPFMNYESVYMTAVQKIEEQHEDGDVLLTHVGVHNAVLNECFLVRNWSVVNFDDSKFDRVFAGHFHCHQNVMGQSGRANVWYPGSPIPFTYAEGTTEHGFIVYDTETRDVEFFDAWAMGYVDGPPPKFLTVDDVVVHGWSDEERQAAIAGNNVRVVLTRDYSRDELHRLRLTLKESSAAEVKWQQRDKTDEKAGESKAQTETSIAKSDELFKRWIDHDKPKGLSGELLLKLNDRIAAVAKERVQDVEDSEAI